MFCLFLCRFSSKFVNLDKLLSKGQAPLFHENSLCLLVNIDDLLLMATIFIPAFCDHTACLTQVHVVSFKRIEWI